MIGNYNYNVFLTVFEIYTHVPKHMLNLGQKSTYFLILLSLLSVWMLYFSNYNIPSKQTQTVNIGSNHKISKYLHLGSQTIEPTNSPPVYIIWLYT